MMLRFDDPRFAARGALAALALIAAAATPGCKQEPDINAVCQRTDFTTSCTFTNSGGPGAVCVRAILEPKSGGGRVESTAICSGQLAPSGTSAPVRGIFVDQKAVRDTCGASGDDCALHTEPLR
jgi:hypothetical protein